MHFYHRLSCLFFAKVDKNHLALVPDRIPRRPDPRGYRRFPWLKKDSSEQWSGTFPINSRYVVVVGYRNRALVFPDEACFGLGVKCWYQLSLWSPSCCKPTSAWALEHVAPRNFVEFFVTWSWWGQWLLCTFPSDLHHFVYSMVVCTVMFHDITGSLECLKLMFLMFYCKY